MKTLNKGRNLEKAAETLGIEGYSKAIDPLLKRLEKLVKGDAGRHNEGDALPEWR